MRLLLFDVDGTLVVAKGAGRAAMAAALLDVFGTAGPVDTYSFAGKTDPQIIGDLLLAAGVPLATITAQLPAIYARMVEHGRTLFVERGLAPCPGITKLLAALKSRPDVLLGLVTGNIEQTAPLKLAAAGIDPSLFRVGAYGSDNGDRNELPAIAIRRASQLTGHSFNGYHTIVIGDTPADIACARASGATAVAVATGFHPAATLSQYQPDYLFETLEDTEKVLNVLLNTEFIIHHSSFSLK
ncbi:MAG: HAD family hydrolase [Chloroflexota bacterium]